MAERDIRTFEEFWPFYVREHSNETNRALHFVGTTLVIATTAAGILTGRRSLFLAAPVFGYGFAWFGHFVFEGNRPATFTYPLWSLRSDFIMWWKILNGTMTDEVLRVTQQNGVHSEPANETSPAPN
jgi:hypothetical protein